MMTRLGIDRSGPATAETLAERPVRFIDAKLESLGDGCGMLTVIAPPRRRLRHFGFAERTRSFEFDAIGVFVWQSIDGRTSVAQIVDRLAKRFDLNRRDAQVPTLQFLQMLTREGLAGVPEAVRRYPSLLIQHAMNI